ncbi:hypothetical protein [Ruminococcus flavefaciens]|uniref:hypothetical protein n=1 Tax=Ruminococcus flavefaciens TaxID=1265 RepID=UPI0003635B0F|nr:hypothetical protein [Ruminococcus flavefaciens]
MKPAEIIKSFPTGNPAGEIAKLALLVVATVLVDALSEVIKDNIKEDKSPFSGVIFKEDR